jgi:hypothetical protein
MLENAGIAAQVTDDLTATMVNYGAAGGMVDLLVAASEASRALALLQAHQESVRRDDEWMDETQEDVWVCSLCGTAVDKDGMECTACQTPRDAVQTGPDARRHLRPAWPDELNEPRDRITAEEPLAPPPVAEPDKEIEAPNLLTLYGDGLARRAFLVGFAPVVAFMFLYTNPLFFLLFYFPFWCYSAWCLIRLAFFGGGDLGRAGLLFLAGAIVVNLGYVGVIIYYFAILFIPPVPLQ